MSKVDVNPEREHWVSKTGFVLAAAGSAVGLGNLWMFPFNAGANGGGAFVFVYLIILFLLGATIMIAELTLGRHTQLNAVGAYRKISEKWVWVGGMGIVTAFLILAFYSVVGGWVIKYLLNAITGAFNGVSDPAVLGSQFDTFTAGVGEPILFLFLFMAATFIIVYWGIEKGIEKYSKIMMPLLFIFIIILAVRSMTLEGAGAGIAYFLVPDFAKINGTVILNAMGQVFFSLSLGLGCMVTYGSYLDKDSNIAESGVVIPVLDTTAAILAGLAILPAVFAFNFDPAGGPGLMFVTLPAIFSQMPFGQAFSILFFVLVLFAALTSSISMLETVVAYLVDEKKINRKVASTMIASAIFLLAVPASLSQGVLKGITLLPQMGFFDTYAFLSNNIMLPLGGLFLCIVVGWVWGTDKAVAEIRNEGRVQFELAGMWSFLVKFIAPVAILFIFISSLGLIK